ncbi:hypothetical protein [Nocardia huaxiensis]|uniref:Uncharacterized protein n=1 Tax=Nocardia huaxiensis TaxID=2755382 RepID=A0A7D6V629_9NOCA|nr:hypothetical protein [Nocardia huaxiensis]QLY28381.1 hypothetical protein H0264_23750 [Nocardia huaxiensis]UFS98167.1 hypothetical protein LPY97_09855 [Nocardia huaxiensis]
MIYESNRSITSSITFEWADCLPGREEPAWELSWRPEPLLTREQARAAMELTEWCSGGAEPGKRAEEIAAELGTTVQHVMAVLHQRMLERGRP